MEKLILLLIIFFLLVPFIVRAGYVENIYNLIDRVALFLYVIGGAIALIVLLTGGITYMTAAGNEDKVKTAKKIIVNGLIGAAIVFCSGFILDLLVEFLKPLTPLTP